jgi:GNAT superfamily N-acetyltransferase
VAELTAYRKDHERATSQVLGRAFASDPVFAWMVESDARKTTWCMRQGIRMTAPHGVSQLALEERVPVAAALWVPPHRSPHVGLARHIAIGGLGALATCGIAGTRRILAREDDVRARYIRDLRAPTWVLDLLGVDPAHQGRGLGRMLLREGLARVDGERAAAYLVTYNPANVALYRGFGFEVVDCGARPGLPTAWSMLRARRA